MLSNILFTFFLCSLVLVAVVANHIQAVNGRIKITTLTTAGCPDTVRFINEQLAPAYEAYGELLDIEFVPWGRTVRYDNGTFYCQFSQVNCWANRLQRCVLNLLKDNQDAQMRYMTCEFGTVQPAFHNNSYLCAVNEGLSLVDVDYCLNNRELDNLDDIAEEASQEPMEVINFVPAIVINDIVDYDIHSETLKRLESMVCFALADINNTDVSFCHVDVNFNRN
ncbi:GILT-like protein 1 [Galleria mellonella]|uniref:GILT-like protein 1 n=1 Tax=Galleria mellonella TaxID=7137 RepID=A0A6J1WX91_GALME|nr:GILT-like protein 1 [Galleria mellonella]